MAADAEMVQAVVIAVVLTIVHQVIALVERVASIARPSLGSHSLSAVAPDNNLRKELALAGA